VGFYLFDRWSLFSVPFLGFFSDLAYFVNIKGVPDYTAKNSSSIGLFLPPQVIGAGAGKCLTWLLIDSDGQVPPGLSIART
jgi:hypothetical protein